MMNTGTVDIEYRHQLSEVLRLRFDEKLSIRAISQQVSMSHSTVHIMVQRFAKSGVPWPLPKKLSAEHLDVILFTGRRKTTKKVPETRLPSDDSWRTRPRTVTAVNLRKNSSDNRYMNHSRAIPYKVTSRSISTM